MALGKNQIRKANEEYYCGTYFRILGRIKCFGCAIGVVLIWQFITYNMKQEFLREKYTKLAGITDLQGTEVCDWVESQVNGNQTYGMGIVIISATILFLACVIATYSIKNYRLYKHKLVWSIALFGIMVTEVGLLYLTRPEEIKGIQGDNLIYIIFILLEFLTLITNLGALLPVELKKPLEGLRGLLGFITDRLLKKM